MMRTINDIIQHLSPARAAAPEAVIPAAAATDCTCKAEGEYL